MTSAGAAIPGSCRATCASRARSSATAASGTASMQGFRRRISGSETSEPARFGTMVPRRNGRPPSSAPSFPESVSSSAGARRMRPSTRAGWSSARAPDPPARVDGLILLAPALELTLSGKLGALLGGLPFLRGTIVPKRAGSDVSDPEMRRRNPCMDAVPLAAVAELLALEAHVARQLPGIAAPALVIHGAHDHTVTLAGARRLARRIGSGPAELVVLRRSWHLVGIDVERDRCADEATRFREALPLPGRRAARQARRRTR